MVRVLLALPRIEHPDVRLPERVHGEGYGRKPIPEQMFVPECY